MFFSPTDDRDKNRQMLNEMIRNYVLDYKDQDRIYLVDLDKGISCHSINDTNERQMIQDDMLHLKPARYNRMASLIFETIKNK